MTTVDDRNYLSQHLDLPQTSSALDLSHPSALLHCGIAGDENTSELLEILASKHGVYDREEQEKAFALAILGATCNAIVVAQMTGVEAQVELQFRGTGSGKDRSYISALSIMEWALKFLRDRNPGLKKFINHAMDRTGEKHEKFHSINAQVCYQA